MVITTHPRCIDRADPLPVQVVARPASQLTWLACGDKTDRQKVRSLAHRPRLVGVLNREACERRRGAWPELAANGSTRQLCEQQQRQHVRQVRSPHLGLGCSSGRLLRWVGGGNLVDTASETSRAIDVRFKRPPSPFAERTRGWLLRWDGPEHDRLSQCVALYAESARRAQQFAVGDLHRSPGVVD